MNRTEERVEREREEEKAENGTKRRLEKGMGREEKWNKRNETKGKEQNMKETGGRKTKNRKIC